MTRTAKRRWTKGMDGEVDGIALAPEGPVLVHGYDPPAGGKWIDSVIPGKLAALDRQSGEVVWHSPCEVGYGRGFGAGFDEEDVVVLGPSLKGHRIVRMALTSGELVEMRDVEPFDEALVAPDVCVCVTPKRIFGVHTAAMVEVWSHAREGERYHQVGRDGEHAVVAYTHESKGKQGVFRLAAEAGDFAGDLFDPSQKRIHAIASGGGVTVLLIDDLLSALPAGHLSSHPQAATLFEELDSKNLWLVAYDSGASPGDDPLWYEVAGEDEPDHFPDILIALDAGRLYVTRAASVEVKDARNGRSLGELAVPGLDEHLAWTVRNGSGVLAEETRVSVFELSD